MGHNLISINSFRLFIRKELSVNLSTATHSHISLNVSTFFRSIICKQIMPSSKPYRGPSKKELTR